MLEERPFRVLSTLIMNNNESKNYIQTNLNPEAGPQGDEPYAEGGDHHAHNEEGIGDDGAEGVKGDQHVADAMQRAGEKISKKLTSVDISYKHFAKDL
jgi:hypothetical protein